MTLAVVCLVAVAAICSLPKRLDDVTMWDLVTIVLLGAILALALTQ